MTAMTTTTMMIIKKRRMGTWCLSWIVRVTWRKDTDTKNIIRNATVINICTKLSRSSSQSSDCSSLYLSSSQCSGTQFFFISITDGFCEITIKEIIVRIIQRIIIYIGHFIYLLSYCFSCIRRRRMRRAEMTKNSPYTPGNIAPVPEKEKGSMKGFLGLDFSPEVFVSSQSSYKKLEEEKERI